MVLDMQMIPSTRLSRSVSSAVRSGWTPSAQASKTEHAAFMADLARHIPFSDGEIATIDGIRVDLPDAWGLIRPSNTTPSLILRFEADDAAALWRIQERFRGWLGSVRSGLHGPAHRPAR